MAKKNKNELDDIISEGLSPAEKLAELRKSQAKIRADAVRRGRDKFAKDYIEPLAKTAGSFSPLGPVIGLTDAYNAYQKGDNTGAIIGAGLEVLPYSASKISKHIPSDFFNNIKIGNYEILPTPKPTAHYRNIGGEEGYLDVINRGEVAPPVVERTSLRSSDGKFQLPKKQFNRAYYANKGEFSPSLRYSGPYAVEADFPMRNGFGGNWGYAPDPIKSGYANLPIDIPEVRLLKQYRLPKTEKVLFQKNLPKKENGGELYFLGGLTGATAMTGGADIAGKMTEFIPTDTKGGAAASGALKGASMGSALGPYGMAAGAILGAGAGFITAQNKQNREAFNENINSIKERNQMLGIKANGGYIIPLGVSPNMTSQYEDGGMLTEFNNGGTHEDSPYQGIPQGVAPNGEVNKVEQGETKWQDYIFSDRLILDENSVQQHNLPKSMAGKTFAEASKSLSKLIKERPNDVISKNTHKDYMKHLMMANDQSRQIEESTQMAMGGRLYEDGDFLNLEDPRILARFTEDQKPMSLMPQIKS